MFVLHLFTFVRRDFTIRHNHHQGDHRHFLIYRRCRSIGRQRLPIDHHNRQIHHLLTTTGSVYDSPEANFDPEIISEAAQILYFKIHFFKL
ncbi:hypothetical protein Hdeb2414_s0005g00174621 [Helianthus debilis subsp. tardiflorus]